MVYEILKTQRREQGFSQAEFARMLGLTSRNAYALKENGQRRFTVQESIAIAHLLGTTVESLFSSPQVTKMEIQNA